VHLVDFIIRIYHDVRSPERQINFHTFVRIPKYMPYELLKRITLKSCKIVDFVISKPVDRQKNPYFLENYARLYLKFKI